ncbi:unnamed protein product [Ilex paraguariensis]|uniref:Uncharacterized protein n=1 Tax=Ilex paraguariensis TaxID=185542 RepID=A0ABC8SLC2_9AQUA
MRTLVQQQETSMAIYFEDRFEGPNATAMPVTGIPGHLWTYASFGTLSCTDVPITEGLSGSWPKLQGTKVSL